MHVVEVIHLPRLTEIPFMPSEFHRLGVSVGEQLLAEGVVGVQGLGAALGVGDQERRGAEVVEVEVMVSLAGAGDAGGREELAVAVDV